MIREFTLKKTEGKTKPPARFTEGTLLKAMENPVKYMQQKDAKAAKTLQETGGLGTVATRADIIEKLFSGFLLEKKGEDIYTTAKARQLLELVPEDLRKPELTAEWEMKLSKIAEGKLSDRKFMNDKQTLSELRETSACCKWQKQSDACMSGSGMRIPADYRKDDECPLSAVS